MQSLYEPGSTFKIVSVTSAVDSGKATFDTMINCTPYPVPGSRPVTDAPRSYGGLTVAGVLKKSSNPGAFRIALKSGWPTYKKYFDLYGFSSKTGIDLPGGNQQPVPGRQQFCQLFPHQLRLLPDGVPPAGRHGLCRHSQ